MRYVLLIGVLLVTGCEDRSIEAYRAPKQTRPTLIDAADPPITSAAADAPHWTPPDGWTPGPSAPLRVATFTAHDGQVEVAITVFPGDVGGTLANVNRWREQIELAPAASLDGQPLQQYEVAGRAVYQLDLPGLTAAGVRDGDRTWFIKMTGPADAVTAQGAAFEAFLRSWHWHGEGEAGEKRSRGEEERSAT